MFDLGSLKDNSAAFKSTMLANETLSVPSLGAHFSPMAVSAAEKNSHRTFFRYNAYKCNAHHECYIR